MKCSRHGRAARRAVLAVLAAVALHLPQAHADVVRVIEDPVGETGGEFGRTLAATDDVLVIGAPGTRVLGHDGAGLVQVFTTDGVWLRRLQAPTPRTDARFGTAVAALEGLVYVGAPGDRPIGVGGLGAVYVFDAASGVVVRVLRPLASGASGVPIGGVPLGSVPSQSTAALPEAAGFGRALAVAGDRIVVGAPDSVVDDVAGAGAVYVFDGQGTLVRTLRDVSPMAHARVGAAVTLVDDLVFAGAPGASALGVDDAGAVRIFDVRTGDPFEGLVSPEPVRGARFGAAGTNGANAFVVGAPGEENLGSEDAGTVYVFPPGRGVLPTVIPSPATTPGADFGRAVIPVDGDLLVGADGAGLSASGLVYLVDPATTAVRATFAPTTATPGGRFGFALVRVGTKLAVGAPALGARSGSAGRVYLFERGVGTGGTGASRTAPSSPVVSAGCAQAPTTASAGCRLGVLVGTVTRAGLGQLANPLLRAQRELRRAAVVRERRRARAIHRAGAQVQAFVRRVAARDVPAALRDALVTDAGAVASDLVVVAP